jgi:hypothetical protein
MSIAVITTFPEKNYKVYGERMIDSFVFHWPKDIPLYVYYEGERPPKHNAQIKYVDLHDASPQLVAFKDKYKNDPVANGEVNEIPGGVRRLKNAGKNDKGKGSFLWDAVRFSHKTFCVAHAIKTIDADMILWLDADTYTFANIPNEFVRSTLPEDKLTCYLGRGGMYPECGWVGYNKKHPKIMDFIKAWTDLYTKDTIFNEVEWHDSYLYWQILQRVAPNDGHDIGVGSGHDGQHIFVNSDLGQYIDHMKGKRKIQGSSAKSDLRKQRTESYWQNIHKKEFMQKLDEKTKQEIISKVEKGTQGN